MVNEELNLSPIVELKVNCSIVPLGKVMFASTVSTATLSVALAAISRVERMLKTDPAGGTRSKTEGGRTSIMATVVVITDVVALMLAFWLCNAVTVTLN